MLLLPTLLSLAVALNAGKATPPRPSSLNCTWGYFSQPLDHFTPGATVGAGATLRERYCLYSGFAGSGSTAASAPVFFYVGNESPVEEYVNGTGLMWTLGPVFGAHLVFAEHRYFGKSVPALKGVPNCLSYCTSAQALADYATLVRHLQEDVLHNAGAPVIAFGGSYGGMLASWARMKYPATFTGAIAASAPILGFPLTNPPLDGAFTAITHAASTAGGVPGPEGERCSDNVLASWPLIREVGATPLGRELLASTFRLCGAAGQPRLPDTAAVERLIQYLQAPWFLIAEGDFPFPSTYITFAVGNSNYPLPAWPMRVACAHVGGDFGVALEGNVSDVKFVVVVDDVRVTVDWNTTSSEGVASEGINNLFAGLREAVGVWYNVSGALPCFDMANPDPTLTDPTLTDHSAPEKAPAGGLKARNPNSPHSPHSPNNSPNKPGSMGRGERGGVQQPVGSTEAVDEHVCTSDTIPGGNAGAWDVICCNENLNLVNGLLVGVGNDMFWPPSVPSREYNTTALIAASTRACTSEYAKAGLFGVPRTADPFATWEEVYYGGRRALRETSNIVFSNGALDPWSSAGVLESVSPSVQAVLLDLGAHHLDLFFPDDNDPPCAAQARKVEAEAIRKWIGAHGAH